MALAAYLQAEVFRHLDLESVKGSRAFKSFLTAVPEGGKHVHWGGGFVANNYIVLRTNYPLARRYVAAVCSVRSIGVEDGVYSTIYAYVYWPLAPGAALPTDPTPEYVCIGPTYSSQDGEYRGGLLWWSEVEALYADAVFSPLASSVEADVLSALSHSEIVLNVRVFPDEAAKMTSNWLDDLRLPLKLFVLCQLRAVQKTTSPPHLVPQYGKAMAFMLEATRQNLVDISPEVVQKLPFMWTGRASRTLICGQKLVPLTRAAAVQVGNIAHSPWRELWAAQKASDLVLNGRTTALPLFNDWFIITGANAELFENEAMLKRHHTSRAVGEALKQLEDVRATMWTAAGEAVDPLDDQFLRGIRVGEAQYLLAEYVLCLTMENKGLTLATLKAQQRRLKLRVQAEDFETVLFDYAYGCFVLHAVGIHGDLHLNNVTVHCRASYQEGLCTAFVAGPDEADTYVLPNTGTVGSLVDFSRILINPKHQPELAEQLGETQAAAIFRDQATRVLHLMHLAVPEFATAHQEAIKGAAYTQPQAVYDVLVAVDYLLLGRNLGNALSEKQPADQFWQPGPSIAKLCRNMEEVATEELISGFRALIDKTPAAGAKASRQRTVGQRILRAVFSDYLYSNWDPADLERYVLADVQRADAPLAYSGSALETLPPWMQPDNLVRNSAGLTIDQILSRGDRAIAEAAAARAAPDPRVEQAISAEREKLRPEPDRRQAYPHAYQSWL